MYVIIGANGYFGAYLIKNVLEMTDEKILAVSRHAGQSYGSRVEWAEYDITKPGDALDLNERYLKKEQENKILFLAAYHHPDLVAKHPRIAWNTNITALSRFLNLADNVSRFFYPSTDSVYGEGSVDRRFKETDELRPVNRYGEQKTAAEKLVTVYGYHVLRFPFLIAPSLLSEKKHFYDNIADSLKAGQPFKMFSDSYRSTLSFDTAARLTVELAESKRTVPKIINVCGDKAYSKYDVGLRIADRLGVSRELIVPVSIASQSSIFMERRASSTVMDNTLLKKTLGCSSVLLEL